MGFVFLQSERVHHGTIMFCFTASANVCDVMGVLYRKRCESLGFFGVGKGKKPVAARTPIPGS